MPGYHDARAGDRREQYRPQHRDRDGPARGKVPVTRILAVAVLHGVCESVYSAKGVDSDLSPRQCFEGTETVAEYLVAMH
jgi:hypothetical protein